MNTKRYKNLIYTILIPLFIACEKWVEIGTPENQLASEKVFVDPATLNAALGGVYADLEKSIDGSYNKFLGIYTDELAITSSNQDYNEFYTGSLTPTNTPVANIWSRFYFLIYQVNDIIERLESSAAIPNQVTNSAIAQALFIRSFAFYNLYNCFGELPLITTTDVTVSSIAKRSDSTAVFNRIVEDLKSADQMLGSADDHDKTRANKWAVKALLARVMLHQRNWEEADRLSTEIIESGLFTPLGNLSDVFLSSSKESIFQLWTQNGFITDAAALIPSSGNPTYPITIELLNSFEPGDLRKDEWINSSSGSENISHYLFKYKNRNTATFDNEYLSVLRISEQLLIRAEANANMGKLDLAVSDVNVIRHRAKLEPIAASLNLDECLLAIEKERRTELFLEWGQRFMDLKRTGKLDSKMSKIKAEWSPYSVYFPIPQNELIYNKNLTQNTGY